VDAIVATGNPFVLFRYASRLSRELGIPWVADFRDPWSQDKRSIGYKATPSWAARVERRYVASASVITTVADSFRDLLARLHPGKPVVVIPNGYDPEAMAAANGIEQDRERFTLAFTGSVYGWHPVESVFRQLDAFNADGPRAPIHLRLIGVGGREELEALLRTRFPALAAHASFTGRLPNDLMAAELARANAFLMFNNYAYPGTKIFDYLALRRRIILCYADDPEAMQLKRLHYNIEPTPGTDERTLEKIIEATRSGVVVRDALHLQEVLGDLHREFLEAGSIACRPQDTEQYSRRTQAGRLAAILRELPR
jgi:glycosyltransferase involved in cell wall biosynthesis